MANDFSGSMEAAVLRVVNELYTAAEDASHWPVALSSICDLLGGNGAHLISIDLGTHTGNLSVAARTDPDALELYNRYFHRVDPWNMRLRPHQTRPGQVILGRQLVSPGELMRSEFYSDLGHKFDLTNPLVGFLQPNDKGASALISINRSERAVDWDATAINTFRLLIPHLNRALALHRRLYCLANHLEAVTDVLERVAGGIVLLDGSAKVIAMNGKARDLVADSDGITVSEATLRATDPVAAKDLVTQLVRALDARGDQWLDAASSVVIAPRYSGKRPLQVLVTPLRCAAVDCRSPSDPRVAVFVADPELEPVADEKLLLRSFGLTPAEAKVAAKLAAGKDCAEISDELSYTIETTRWYVKQVLAKASCRNRTQFAKLAAVTLLCLRPG